MNLTIRPIDLHHMHDRPESPAASIRHQLLRPKSRRSCALLPSEEVRICKINNRFLLFFIFMKYEGIGCGGSKLSACSLHS